jgi:DNA-binding SARP family transcriptional activator/tetratricopeptide (TPR) repeat protein/TolB-like protein
MATPFQKATASTDAATAANGAPRWECRLFGAFRLWAPDGSPATPVGRKARALVAFLLTTTEDGVARDRLARLLWSERGEDQARASLRQVLHEIRPLTAGDAPLIALDRSRVRVVAGAFSTDLEAIAAAARPLDATVPATVTGEQLHGFLADLDGIDPAFDDWLTVERTRRCDQRRRVLLGAAERLLIAGHVDDALQMADRLMTFDSADEFAASIAMRASHRRGERDAVRRIFARLQEALKRQIGATVSDETLALYRRLVASPVSGVSPAPLVFPIAPSSIDIDSATRSQTDVPAATEVSETAAAMPPPSRPPRRWRLPSLAGIGCALLLVGTGGALWWRLTLPDPARRVLLVEPIQVASDDAYAAVLRTGFTAELARVIVGKPDFVVRDADQAADGAADAPGQTFVVATEAQSHDAVLHVGLRLLARKDGPILWATTMVGPVGDVDALREQMAVKVADVAVCALDGRHTDLRDFRPSTLQLLLRACDLRHIESLETAKILEQLTRQVPEFSHGWAMLAAVTTGERDPMAADANGSPTRTESYARRAIERDPHDGEAYVGRAFDQQGTARWPQRMAILREGLAMDPVKADVQIAMAIELAQVGYWQQAMTWSERALQNDPFSPFKAAFHARLLGMGFAGPEAARAFSDARRRFGIDRELALAEFRYQALVGDHRRASQLLLDPNQGLHFQPVRAAMWNALLAMRAEPSPAHEAEAEQAFLAAIQAIPDINPWTLETLSLLHRVDEAYVYADRMPPRAPWDDSTDALFDVVTRPLRADPRFMTLADRLGFVTIWRTTGQWPDFCNDPDLGYDCRVEADRAQSTDRRPLVAPR